MKPRHHLVVAAAFMLLSACTSTSSPDRSAAPVGPATQSEAASGDRPVRFSPPPLTVASDTGATVELQPISYCWAGPDVALCTDGDPWQFEQPELAGAQSFALNWPIEGWTWTVTPKIRGGACGPVLGVLDDRVAGQPIAAPTGGDLVLLEGAGPEGDVTFAFTPQFTDASAGAGGTVTLAFASASEEPSAHNLALTITNLSSEPRSLTAEAFVRGGEGRIAEFELETLVSDGCFAGSMVAALDVDTDAADLNGFEPPIEISVDLVIDGVVHRSDPVTWPADFGPTSPLSPALTFISLGT